MIRYAAQLSPAHIEAQVDAHDPVWRPKAAARTATLLAAGAVIKASPIWSEVKSVFMAVQRYKCVYCERPLGGQTSGSIEHDVEHYRPKGRIKAWPDKKSNLAYDFATGPPQATGYYWLAYDLLNYAAACKLCNTVHKSNFFPIRAHRGQAPAGVAALNASEEPLVIFPFGAHGDDPAGYITFLGIMALPRHTDGPAYERAQVTIDFFGLNSREELWRGRFEAIDRVFLAIETINTSSKHDSRQRAEATLSEAVSDYAPHSACASAFLELARTDGAEAWGIHQEARRFLRGKGLSS
jgi:hypothetical protein